MVLLVLVPTSPRCFVSGDFGRGWGWARGWYRALGSGIAPIKYATSLITFISNALKNHSIVWNLLQFTCSTHTHSNRTCVYTTSLGKMWSVLVSHVAALALANEQPDEHSNTGCTRLGYTFYNTISEISSLLPAKETLYQNLGSPFCSLNVQCLIYHSLSK